jgi:mannose-6-phosphate isomerase-like protein (cupin superfamily)
VPKKTSERSRPLIWPVPKKTGERLECGGKGSTSRTLLPSTNTRKSAPHICQSIADRESDVHDTFYVLEGTIRLFLQQPKEEVRLSRGQTFSVPPKRPHLVTNAGDTSAVFLVLQGVGEYDFVPLA